MQIVTAARQVVVPLQYGTPIVLWKGVAGPPLVAHGTCVDRTARDRVLPLLSGT